LLMSLHPSDDLRERAKQTQSDILSQEFASILDRDQTIVPSLRDQFFFPQKHENICVSEHGSVNLSESDSKNDQHSIDSIPNSDCLYFCGNSLGLQPKSTKEYINAELQKWATYGVNGHFVDPLPWVTVDETVVEGSARLVGALPIEIAIMNSLTANLHFMMVSFYRPTQARFKIVMEGKAFPSDKFAIASQIKFHGFDPAIAIVEVFPREGEHFISTSDIEAKIREHGDSVALVLFSGVQYYTGQWFQMERITQVGHEVGACVGFDLAHAVGNVPLKLHDWGVDFACWCSYKYLNSGPGSIGGCFVHEKHANDTTLPRFEGWWGHRKQDRFQMAHNFVPASGAFGFQLSNPPVLLCASLRASLDIFDQVGIDNLRKRSLLLTAYLELLLKTYVQDFIEILTPANPDERGCQLSISFHSIDTERVFNQLRLNGIICDVRQPNVIRVAPAPLYNTFSDIYEFVKILRTSISNLK